MQLSNAPSKLTVPFAEAGGANTIPVPSQISVTPGAASYTDGFPPLTRTPIASGGVPPNGLDMNGILKAATAPSVWFSGGGGFPFDSVWSTAVGGYPQGARVLRTDGSGYWLNTVDNNTTDPESSGGAAAGWVPDTTYGIAPVTLTASDVTLTAAQYGKPIISLSGTLTANVNLNFPAIVGQWLVVNNCSGAFSVTCKTLAGSGVIAPPSSPSKIYGDATNVYMSNASTAAIMSLTGDVTASGPGSATATLAASGVAPGSYSGANITVDSKGRVTSASSSTPPFTGTSGHQILDSGLILQWGSTGSLPDSSQVLVNFPISFPNAVFSICASMNNNVGSNIRTIQCVPNSTAGFYIMANGSSASASWFAIGY